MPLLRFIASSGNTLIQWLLASFLDGVTLDSITKQLITVHFPTPCDNQLVHHQHHSVEIFCSSGSAHSIAQDLHIYEGIFYFNSCNPVPILNSETLFSKILLNSNSVSLIFKC